MPATSAPHVGGTRSVGFIMAMVMLALTPGTLLGIEQFGWPAANLLVLTIVTALIAEAAGLVISGKPVRVALMDGSAVLTAWLLALSLPPWAPWWIGVVGALFAVIIGKHLFGGLGQNVFNPAMLARTVLLISFPVEMTAWIAPQPMFSAHAPGFMDSLAITAGLTHMDAVSSASLLGHVKTTLGIDGHAPLPAIIAHSFHPLASFMGTTPGSLGETSALLFVIGGLFLIYLRIISWHIPASMLAAVAILAWGTHTADPLHFAPPLFHLLNGGLVLGAFFIATDPVTSPVSASGKLVFGTGCGVLVFIIRQWGGYPEGVAFSVLLMNAATPLIDHYLRPRIFGRRFSGEPAAAKRVAE